MNSCENRLLLSLNNDILRSLSGRWRGCLQNDICIGRLRDAAFRNSQHAVFNRSLCLVIVCQSPLNIRRNREGIAVLVAGKQRNLGQVICHTFYCRRSAAVIIQLVQIRLCHNLHGHRLCRLVNLFALFIFSDRIGQSNGIGADHKAGNYVARNLGITLIRCQLPLVLTCIKRHILAVLILCFHLQRGQIKGICRIIIINQIRDGAGHRKGIEIPRRQNLQLYTIGFHTIDNCIDLIGAGGSKSDGSRCLINSNAIVLFRIPFNLSCYIEIVAFLILSSNGQRRDIGCVIAVIEIERLETAFHRYGGKFHRMDGQFNQLTPEVCCCLNGTVRLIAEEQCFSIIGLQSLQHGIAIPVGRDCGILRGVIEVLVYNRPCAAQAGVEAVPGDIIRIESLDLNAVEAHILLLIQLNGLCIGSQPSQCIEGIHLAGRDDGVFGGIVEIAEIRRNRLTGAQCVRCGFEIALVEDCHIQLVGVIARDIAVLDSGVQILHCGHPVAAEGIFSVVPSFPVR